jgi:hypothetical protein
MDAERRSMVRKVGVAIGVGALAAPVVVSKLRPAPLASERFASIDATLNTLAQLKNAAPRMAGAWDLAHVLHHTAQSVEYSMAGFPALKPAWFRATLGSYAFALFNSRGAMSHDLAEPIPGAPAIALRAFDAHTAALQPHFAYGTLDKPAYTRAHLMHLANHWNEAAVAA